MKVVADKGHIDPESCTYLTILARKDLLESGVLEDASGIKGLRIKTAEAHINGYFLYEVLNQYGLSFEDVEILDIPNPASQQAIEQGDIDMFTGSDPWIARMLSTGLVDFWYNAEDVLPELQLGVIVFGPSLLEDNREAGERFIAAYLKGVEQYNLGKTERNLEIMAEYSGQDKETLIQSCWPPIRTSGWVDFAGVDGFQDFALEMGFLDERITEAQFWDPSFIEVAGQE